MEFQTQLTKTGHDLFWLLNPLCPTSYQPHVNQAWGVCSGPRELSKQMSAASISG